MAEVTKEHRVTARNLRAAYIRSSSYAEEVEFLAQALANAEQRGAERERAAIIAYYYRVHGIGLVDVEAGKHLEPPAPEQTEGGNG